MSSTQDRSVSGMVDGPNRAVTTLLPLSTVLAIAVEKVYGKGSFPGAFLQIHTYSNLNNPHLTNYAKKTI